MRFKASAKKEGSEKRKINENDETRQNLQKKSFTVILLYKALFFAACM